MYRTHPKLLDKQRIKKISTTLKPKMTQMLELPQPFKTAIRIMLREVRVNAHSIQDAQREVLSKKIETIKNS